MSAIHFEALEARTFLTVTVTDLDPAKVAAPEWWYGSNSHTVNVPNYTDPNDGLIGLGTYIKADHDEAFTAKVGTFKDNQLGSPADYRATVRLDGQTTPATLVRNNNGGMDVLITTQLTWGWHAFDVQVSDVRDSSRGSSFDSAAFVLAPAISGEAVTLKVRAGHVFDGVVGKYAGIDPDLLGQYEATINWGDGGSSTGTVELLDGTNAAIHGSHTYTTPGLHDITVYLTTRTATQMPKIESGGIMWGRRDSTDYPASPNFALQSSAAPATRMLFAGDYSVGHMVRSGGLAASIEARSQITVLRANLVGDSVARSTIASIKSTNTLARFDVLDLDVSDLSRYQTIVEIRPPGWYDEAGSHDRAPFTVPAVLSLNSDGKLEVSIDQMLPFAGYHAFTIRILDTSRSADTQVGYLQGQFDNASPITVKMQEIDIVGGQSIDTPIARISVVGESLWDSRLKADVNIGNTVLPGRLVSLGNGQYDVYVDYTPAATRGIGQIDVNVHVVSTRTALSGNVASPEPFEARSSSWVWYEPALYSGFELDNSRLNEHGYSGRVDDSESAYFTLGTGLTGANRFAATDFTGVIEWSDGTTTEIDFDATDNRYYGNLPSRSIDPVRRRTFEASVSPGSLSLGLHTGRAVIMSMGQRLEFAVEITVFHSAPVSTPQPTPQFGTLETLPVTAIRGQDWEGVVGSFVPNDPSVPPSSYDIIVYLEGVAVAGRLVAAGHGSYDVVAKFNFDYETKADRYSSSTRTGGLQININLGGNILTAYDDDQIQVDSDPTKLSATREQKTFRQFESFTTTLARFSAPNDSRDVSDFRAVIDWGDGTTTDGVISTRYRGGYDVTGSHQYRTEGQFTPIVSIYRGSEYTRTRASLYMTHHPVEVTPDAPLSEGLSVNGTIAKFVDADLLGTIDLDQKRINHAALIDWGDGTISTGDLVKRADGGFDVVGDHTYAQAGEYTIAVTVRQNEVYLPQISPWRDGTGYMTASFLDAYRLAADGSSSKPLIASAFVTIRVGANETPTFSFASPELATTSQREGVATLMSLSSKDDLFDNDENDQEAILA